jgi:hypothetical protein
LWGYLGLLLDSALFALPGIEPVVLAKPFLAWIGIRQLATSYFIAGQLLGRAPVAQAHLTLLSGGETAIAHATTDAQGGFTLQDIDAGIYL